MNLWLPAAPCTPARCVPVSGPKVAQPRAVGRLLAGLAIVLLGLLLAPAVLHLGPRQRSRAVRAWARALVRGFGVRIRISGTGACLPLAHGSLVVANHISWLDIPLVASVAPSRMLAKSEIGRWPVLGLLASCGGTLFVDRERLRALPATVDRLAGVLRTGSSVTVYPEGSTWCGRSSGRFRPAAFQAALDAGVAVQPIRITYRSADGTGTTAPAFIGADTLAASLWSVVNARAVTAEVRVLPRIPPGLHTDRRSLAGAAQRSVAGPGVGAVARASHRGCNGPGAQDALASESANRPSESVHHSVSSIPAEASSLLTPS
ncbi:lysophospholipid acyltransferase family protein [Streptomyces sp. NPDC006879]|uniref:lysophospholipid acyltransferase family protein n=1 Tax=Streptomyces sp. NPDC006879 TaxID=3364767 RepID=UPI003676369E